MTQDELEARFLAAYYHGELAKDGKAITPPFLEGSRLFVDGAERSSPHPLPRNEWHKVAWHLPEPAFYAETQIKLTDARPTDPA